nr:phage tail tape measure protein [uncultured Desulfobacter sp.]
MATKLEKLMFSISLLDRVSGPAGRIKKTLGGLTSSASAGFAKIAAGGAGVAAAGYTLHSMVAPANEFNMAIGEVRSLDVVQGSLDALSDSAVAFSIKYGESATDFIRSSYDIQSAIAGLEGDDLAKFTNASNILAKGTKSDAATITDYMGTMYGIFKEGADSMGKAQWVEQLTGQTATAVKMFKTTGSEMAGAFTSLGAEARSAGISQAEQIAVLGQLQATMSGSEAGTKYKAFISGVGGAQEELGLKFTDSAGRMLGVTTIMDKLKGKFGETLDVAESDALKKAFGSDEAVGMIKLLMADTAGLKNNIQAIGEVKGMEQAQKMASSMVDPFQRWSQGVNAVRIGLGQALLPIITPFVEKMAEGAGVIYNWTKEFPNLTRWIGYGVVTITGITAAVATFAAIGGVAALVTTGWSFSVGIASKVIAAFRWVLTAARTSMLFLNTAMWANPVGLIVLVIVALTAAVAGVIYYWDDLKATFLDSKWAKGTIEWVHKIIDKITDLGGVWDAVKGKLSWLPGFGDDSKTNDIPKTSPSLDAPRTASIPPGGASRSIANAVTNNSSQTESRTVNIGQVVTSRPINSQEIGNQLMMGA